MKDSPYISIVSPVYRAENIIDELVKRLVLALEKLTNAYEIILVEDNGPDNSWDKIVENCAKNPNVKGIKLSRNFGQHYAVSAGVFKAKGDVIVLMDCDLQDNPNDIEKLLSKQQEGYDIVFTKRKERKHGAVKTFTAFLYNKLFALFSEREYDVDAGSFVLFTNKVAREFNKLKDKDRLYLQMLKWLGFKTSVVEVEHNERFEGTSSYSFKSLLKIGLQGWTSHSDKLLRLSTYTGFFLSLLSFLAGIYIIISYFFYNLQPGWPSIIVTILFSTGLILLSIGILGIYVGKIFEQAKDRPLFIIETAINLDE